MSKSTNDKIGEILRPTQVSPNLTITFEKEKQELAKLIKETLQECLGQEETVADVLFNMSQARAEQFDIDNDTIGKITRNQLRQEANKKLEELLND